MQPNIMEVVLNPTRQRIIQHLVMHGQGSAGDMLKELGDIPPASLYRHIRLLLDAGLIEIAKEEKIRGTVEKTYRINQSYGGGAGNREVGAMIQTGLLSLMAVFQRYFADAKSDYARDMLSYSTATLMMTDAEYLDFLTGLGGLIREAMHNKPGDGRRPRRLTLISSPSEDDTKGRE